MTIKAGDLVQIVSECCEPGTVRGYVGTVLAISPGHFQCEDCRHEDLGQHANISGLASGPSTAWDDLGWVPVGWLKRIPPPEELGIVDESIAEGDLAEQRRIHDAWAKV